MVADIRARFLPLSCRLLITALRQKAGELASANASGSSVVLVMTYLTIHGEDQTGALYSDPVHVSVFVVSESGRPLNVAQAAPTPSPMARWPLWPSPATLPAPVCCRVRTRFERLVPLILHIRALISAGLMAIVCTGQLSRVDSTALPPRPFWRHPQ